MFEVQCSQCHVHDGFNDLVPLISSWSKDLLAYNLDRIHELKPFMPPLAGKEEERKALVNYLWDLKTSHEKPQEAKADHEPDPQS